MISTNTCAIESYRDSDGHAALARVDRAVNGCAAVIRLVYTGETEGRHWLCRRKDDPTNDYILLLPSARWEQDARDDGFELVQRLNVKTK